MKIGGDDKSAILHFVAVKTPLKRRTLARSDRASVKELSSLSVRQPNVSGARMGDERKAVGSGPPTALLSEQVLQTLNQQSTNASVASWRPANLSAFMFD